MATNQQALEGHETPARTRARRGDTFIAPLDGLSHVSGDRSEPLLHKTIPALFAETAKAYGPRDAAVFVEQDKRFSWNELAEAVDALAAGLLALGLEKGDRIGIWSPNRWEWLVTQFAHGPHRPGAGQHQSGLPPHRARICAEQGRLPRADQRRALQDLRLSRHDRDAGAGARRPPSRAGWRRPGCRS